MKSWNTVVLGLGSMVDTGKNIFEYNEKCKGGRVSRLNVCNETSHTTVLLDDLKSEVEGAEEGTKQVPVLLYVRGKTAFGAIRSSAQPIIVQVLACWRLVKGLKVAIMATPGESLRDRCRRFWGGMLSLKGILLAGLKTVNKSTALRLETSPSIELTLNASLNQHLMQIRATISRS